MSLNVEPLESLNCSIVEQNTPSRGKIDVVTLRPTEEKYEKTANVIMAAIILLSPLVFTSGCAVAQHRESVGAYATDKTIISKIKAAFLTDPVVKTGQIEVKSLNGVVQLSGFADTAEARDRAEQIAYQTKGVVQMYNNILLPTGRDGQRYNQ